jgi:TonB family protein
MPDLAGDASASAPSAPLPYIAAQATRALRLSYPPDATASGSMIVEFTLSAKGSASDVTVVHSDLPRSFDRDAIRAVRRGRYSTRELPDGRAVRARIKLTFNTG